MNKRFKHWCDNKHNKPDTKFTIEELAKDIQATVEKYLEVDVPSKVEEKCFKMGIFINRKKTKIYEVDKNFIYLNHIYRLNNNGHLFEHLEPTTIYRERQKIKKFPELISDGSMTKEKAIQQFSSWRGSFYPYMTRKQRQNMTELFNKTLIL